MHGGDGPHVVAWLLFILFLVLLVGLIVLLVSRLSGGRGGWPAAAPAAGPRTGEDPLEGLRLRYARGEVDRDAFLQASADLGGTPPG